MVTAHEKTRQDRRAKWMRYEQWTRIGESYGKFLPCGRHIAMLPPKGTQMAIFDCKTGKTYAAPDYGSITGGLRACYDFMRPPSGRRAGVWRDESGKPTRLKAASSDHGHAGRQMALQAGYRPGLSTEAPRAVWPSPEGGIRGCRGIPKSTASDGVCRAEVPLSYRAVSAFSA
jgi:hypothetical protein